MDCVVISKGKVIYNLRYVLESDTDNILVLNLDKMKTFQ